MVGIDLSEGASNRFEVLFSRVCFGHKILFTNIRVLGEFGGLTVCQFDLLTVVAEPVVVLLSVRRICALDNRVGSSVLDLYCHGAKLPR